MESILGLEEFSASLFDLLYQAHPPLSNHRRSGTLLEARTNIPPRESKGVHWPLLRYFSRPAHR